MEDRLEDTRKFYAVLCGCGMVVVSGLAGWKAVELVGAGLGWLAYVLFK